MMRMTEGISTEPLRRAKVLIAARFDTDFMDIAMTLRREGALCERYVVDELAVPDHLADAVVVIGVAANGASEALTAYEVGVPACRIHIGAHRAMQGEAIAANVVAHVDRDRVGSDLATAVSVAVQLTRLRREERRGPQRPPRAVNKCFDLAAAVNALTAAAIPALSPALVTTMVLEMLALRDREIGELRGVKPRTVKGHVSEVEARLLLGSRAGFIRRLLELGGVNTANYLTEFGGWWRSAPRSTQDIVDRVRALRGPGLEYGRLIETVAETSDLSPVACATLVAATFGLANKEVASLFGVEPTTVRDNVCAAVRRVHMVSRYGLLRWALEHGGDSVSSIALAWVDDEPRRTTVALMS